MIKYQLLKPQRPGPQVCSRSHSWENCASEILETLNLEPLTGVSHKGLNFCREWRLLGRMSRRQEVSGVL